MQTTRFLGPSENYSPLTILNELDRLLLANGWTRVGADPATLNSAYSALATATNQTRRGGPFGYKHASGDIFWFHMVGPWFKSSANYESVFSMLWSLTSTWSTTMPDALSHVSSQYIDTSHTNESADWNIGASPDGFYVMQALGDRPGGFAIERTADGRWLAQYAENQYRWCDRSGMVIYPFTGSWDGWHQSGLEALMVNMVNGKYTRLGTPSIMELSLYKDFTSSTALTPDGSVQRGYWYQVNNYTPLTSSLVMRFFEPGTYMTVQVGSELRVYRRLSTYGVMNNFTWRVQ